MRMLSVFDHLGKEYESFTVLAREYGLSRQVIEWRLKRGWTLERALTTPAGAGGRERRLTEIADHNGVVYADRGALAAAYGIPRRLLNARLRRGWSMKRALLEPVRKGGEK